MLNLAGVGEEVGTGRPYVENLSKIIVVGSFAMHG